MPPGYVILAGGEAITCLECGRTSYNLNDVAERYCGHCHKFHDEYPAPEARQKQ